MLSPSSPRGCLSEVGPAGGDDPPRPVLPHGILSTHILFCPLSCLASSFACNRLHAEASSMTELEIRPGTVLVVS